MTLRSKNRGLAADAMGILEAEQPMTLRQLYYRAVSAGTITNTAAEYRRLGVLMTRLREAGNIPRTWIVDHTRATLKPSSWSGLADFGDSVRACYRRDFWASLPDHVEVFVEKDAVAGTVQPITAEYDVALRVCRGYSSISFAGEIADLWAQIEKPIYAYYLGDFDPSGFDLERDLREKLQRYSGRFPFDDEGEAIGDPMPIEGEADGLTEYGLAPMLAFRDVCVEEGRRFYWQRLGVTQEDFEDHDLVRLPVKTLDKRAAGFVKRYGSDCAEIDAIPPTELRRRVQQAIERHIDAERWQRLQTVETAERETVERFVEALGRTESYLGSV